MDALFMKYNGVVYGGILMLNFFAHSVARNYSVVTRVSHLVRVCNE